MAGLNQKTIVPVVTAVVTVALIIWISLLAGPLVSEQEIMAQISHEDSSLCARLGFATGTQKGSDCAADLADLRLRHEKLLASRQY